MAAPVRFYYPADLRGARIDLERTDEHRGSLPIELVHTLELAWQEIHRLRKEVNDLKATSTVGGIVSAAQSIIFIDVPLTANHVVAVPSVADNSIVIWEFLQDGTGGWTVTWADAAFVNKPRVGDAADEATIVAMRKEAGPKFTTLWGTIRRKDS